MGRSRARIRVGFGGASKGQDSCHKVNHAASIYMPKVHTVNGNVGYTSSISSLTSSSTSTLTCSVTWATNHFFSSAFLGQ